MDFQHQNDTILCWREDKKAGFTLHLYGKFVAFHCWKREVIKYKLCTIPLCSQNSELETVSANLNAAKLFSYTNLQRWEDMGQCDENVMVFYSVEDNVVSWLKSHSYTYVSLRLRVQNAVSPQPCVGKFRISLVLFNLLHCNFRLWFKTP